MSKSGNEDSKAKFREALEKKSKNSGGQTAGNDLGGHRKISESSGKKPKMFRRKSG